MWRQVPADSIIRHMRFACRIAKATDSHTEYVTLIDFLGQQWFRERASVLLHMYIVSLIFIWTKLRAHYREQIDSGFVSFIYLQFGQTFGCGIVTLHAATFWLFRSVEIRCTLRDFKQVSVVICLAASSLNVQNHVSVRDISSNGFVVGYWRSVHFCAVGHNHPFQQRLSNCDTFRYICIYTYLLHGFKSFSRSWPVLS
jgi:hypothetical protein